YGPGPGCSSARRGGPDRRPRLGPDRAPLLPRLQSLAGPPPRHAPTRGLHLLDALPGLVGAGPVPAATGLPPPTGLRTARRRAAGAGQPQPPGPSRADHAPGPRHPGSLPGPRPAFRLGVAARAAGPAAAAHEGPGRGPLAGPAGAADRRHRPDLLPPPPLPALPGAAAGPGDAVPAPGPGG